MMADRCAGVPTETVLASGEYGSDDRPRSPRILVIDDTQDVLDLFQEVLEEEGYRVTSFQTILTLLQIATLSPDGIVQDLRMPGDPVAGRRVMQQVLIDPRLAQMGLVLCTATDRPVRDRPMAADLARLGVRVLRRPIAITDLLSLLEPAPLRLALVARHFRYPAVVPNIPTLDSVAEERRLTRSEGARRSMTSCGPRRQRDDRSSRAP